MITSPESPSLLLPPGSLRPRKWSFHAALEENTTNKRRNRGFTQLHRDFNHLSDQGLCKERSDDHLTSCNQLNLPQQFRNRIRSDPFIIAVKKCDTLDMSDGGSFESVEGIGRVDSYSHSLLSAASSDQSDPESELGMRSSTDKLTPGLKCIAQKNSALTLASACLGLGRCWERRMSLVSIKENSVTIVGAAKTGKTTLIRRLNLFSSSEGFLHPDRCPVAFLEVTGHLDPYSKLFTSLIVLIFAMNDEDSLISCREWLKEYFKQREGSILPQKSILLVANKSDFCKKTLMEQMRKDAQLLVDQFGLRFLEVSAVLNRNIDKLWLAIKVLINKEIGNDKNSESLPAISKIGKHKNIDRIDSLSCENVSFF